MKLDKLILIFPCIGLPEDSFPANTRPTTINSPLARTATRSSAVPSLKSLIEGQKTISSNTNAISILSFYLIFLLSYQNIILLKKKQKNWAKCSAGLNKTTRFANQPAVTRPGKIQLSVILCGIAYPFLLYVKFTNWNVPKVFKKTHSS